MSNKKIILVVLCILILLGAGYYVIQKYDITKEKFIAFISEYGIHILLSLIILFAIYWFIKKRNDEKNKTPIDLAREIVDVDVAIDAWSQGMIEKTGVPYVVYHEKKSMRIEPARKEDFRIIESHHFDEPGTGVPHSKIYYMMGCGQWQGLNNTIIRRDKGVDWIKKNIWYHNTARTTTHTFKLDNTKFPLATPQGEDARLEVYRIGKIETEGYDEKDLRYVDKLKQSNINPNMMHQEQEQLSEEEKQYRDEINKLNAMHTMAKIKRETQGGR